MLLACTGTHTFYSPVLRLRLLSAGVLGHIILTEYNSPDRSRSVSKHTLSIMIRQDNQQSIHTNRQTNNPGAVDQRDTRQQTNKTPVVFPAPEAVGNRSFPFPRCCSPNCKNKSVNASSVILGAKFPTKIFVVRCSSAWSTKLPFFSGINLCGSAGGARFFSAFNSCNSASILAFRWSLGL